MADQDTTFAQPVQAYLDRTVDADRRLALFAANGHDESLWQHASQEGWFALIAPADDDGLGLEPGTLTTIMRAMGERLVGGTLTEQMLVPGLLLATHEMASTTRTRLVDALSGRAHIAVVDARAASSPLAATPMVRLSDGLLTGVVDLVRHADAADELVVVATTEVGTSIALVDANRAHVVRTPRSSSDPLTTLARVEFRGVRCHDTDVIASGEAGNELAALLSAWTRILTAAELAGAARHLLRISVQYVQDRQQFGKAVGSFQSVKHLAASCAQRVILLENFCEAVSTDATHQSTDELSLAAATLKANASEMARLVAEDALQMHGGIGFTHEHELHWYYKRVLALGSWYGDERALSVEVGRTVLERATAARR